MCEWLCVSVSVRESEDRSQRNIFHILILVNFNDRWYFGSLIVSTDPNMIAGWGFYVWGRKTSTIPKCFVETDISKWHFRCHTFDIISLWNYISSLICKDIFSCIVKHKIHCIETNIYVLNLYLISQYLIYICIFRIKYFD